MCSAHLAQRLFTTYIVAFDRFMHALLGVYMYVWKLLWASTHIHVSPDGNGSRPLILTGNTFLAIRSSAGQWSVHMKTLTL